MIPVEIQGPAPQAIPTITTRVNYDPGQGSVDESFSDEAIDHSNKEIESPASEKFPESSQDIEKHVPIPVEVMDTEEISDGEVFPDDDEDEQFDESRKLISRIVLFV